MQGDLDMSLIPPAPELWLTDPTRNLIAKIENRSGVGFSRFGKKQKFLKHTSLQKLNNINELEFTIPFQIEINHNLVRNTVVDQIVESSLIKCIRNGVEEWFCIVDIKKDMDADKDTMTVSCRSLGYELMRRYVRNFTVIGQNISSLMNGGNTVNSSGTTNVPYNGLLNGTLWTLDSSHDAIFDTIYRSPNISKATVLDAIIQIAKSFNAIVVFDTINRKISFQQLINIGQDKGGRITYQNYMKSLQKESKTDLLVTRLIPYGKNNITINSVTTNGQIGLDDFSFWTFGYTRDIHGVVLTHSPHMSDSLCGSLLDYQNLLNSNAGAFSSLLTTLTGYQTTLTTKQNELVALNTTLLSIQQQLVVAQTSGQTSGVTPPNGSVWLGAYNNTTTYSINSVVSYSGASYISLSTTTGNLPTNATYWSVVSPVASLVLQQSTQQSLITTKQSEINTVNANITSTNTSIANLQATLSTSANFTNAQLTELIPFIRESDWVDSNIDTPQELYNQAQIQFQKYKIPQMVLKVDVVNFYEDVLEQRSWQLYNLGDTVTVEYNVLGASTKAKIIEISFDHAGGNLAITVASLSELLNQNETVIQSIYRSVSAANTLSVNIDNWNGINAATQNINALYNGNILGGKIAINAGVNNNITINPLGLTSIVTSNPNNIVRLSNGNLGFSLDGGNTYTTVLNANGVNAATIVGQLGSFVHMDAASITTGSLVGIIMQIGTGANVFNADSNGISLGAATWATSPFRVNMAGNAWATSMTLNTPAITNGTIVGTTLTLGTGNSVIKADPAFGFWAGNAAFASAPTSLSMTGVLTATGANISGNITMTSGTISWGSIGAPTPAQVGALATSSPMLTNISGTGIYTGTLTATQVNAVAINAGSITVGTLTGINIIGTNITGTSTIKGATITGTTLSTRVNGTGTGVVISSGVADSYWYSGANVLFKIIDGFTQVNIGSDLTISCTGTWNFAGATVTGITATLG